METWAHGQDVADALGVDASEPTDRLRHVAHIGVRARPFSYATNGREVPDGDVRVELRASERRDCGSGTSPRPTAVSRRDALDFCLVVTQRRHVADTDLDSRGTGSPRTGSRSPRPSPGRPAPGASRASSRASR